MNKFYCVYLAYSKFEVISTEESSFLNLPKYPAELARVCIYKNKQDQLDAYANIMCPASQLFEADTEKELNEKVKDFKRKFEDKDWVEKNIEPYI